MWRKSQALCGSFIDGTWNVVCTSLTKKCIRFMGYSLKISLSYSFYKWALGRRHIFRRWWHLPWRYDHSIFFPGPSYACTLGDSFSYESCGGSGVWQCDFNCVGGRLGILFTAWARGSGWIVLWIKVGLGLEVGLSWGQWKHQASHLGIVARVHAKE